MISLLGNFILLEIKISKTGIINDKSFLVCIKIVFVFLKKSFSIAHFKS